MKLPKSLIKFAKENQNELKKRPISFVLGEWFSVALWIIPCHLLGLFPLPVAILGIVAFPVFSYACDMFVLMNNDKA